MIVVENSQDFSPESYIKYLITQMPWPIVICDENHLILDANSSLEKLFLRPFNEIIGHSDDEYLKISEEQLKPSQFANMCRLVLPNGKELLVAVYLTPLTIADGRAILFNVIMDTSQAANMHQEQLKSAELVGIFQTIATVNHQINNPLFGLMATLQMMTEEMKDADPAVKRKLERMTVCAERIKQITDELSQVVRPARRIYAENEGMLDLGNAVGRSPIK